MKRFVEFLNRLIAVGIIFLLVAWGIFAAGERNNGPYIDPNAPTMVPFEVQGEFSPFINEGDSCIKGDEFVVVGLSQAYFSIENGVYLTGEVLFYKYYAQRLLWDIELGLTHLYTRKIKTQWGQFDVNLFEIVSYDNLTGEVCIRLWEPQKIPDL